MKKKLITLLWALPFWASAQAVEILPVGAEVSGIYSIPFSLESGLCVLKVQRNDTINDKIYKRLTTTQSIGAPGWIRQSGDSVYYKLATGPEDFFLVKNNFALGETSQFGSLMGGYSFSVTGIDTIFLDGIAVRRFQISASTFSPYRFIYDRFGPENIFLNWCGGACDRNTFGMCHYSDPAISPQFLPDLNYSCPVSSTSALHSAAGMFIVPTLAFNSIEITVPDRMRDNVIQMFDLSGRLVTQRYMNGVSLTLDVSSLSAGFYTLHCGNAVGRFVKQ